MRDTHEADTGAPPPERDPQSPTFPIPGWDRYQCLRFLGQGGMGQVFLARDPRLHREVAIKLVRGDAPDAIGRLVAEARAQARVSHERVCKVYEVGEAGGEVYIAMEYIEGEPLGALGRTLTVEQAAMILREAALGVHEAHKAGILHRDLKPSNIMVARGEDGALRPYVMDFGLARDWTAEGATESGAVLGTPYYMAPEQARGEVGKLDRRADVYSLGATLYHVLTGELPIPGSNGLEVLNNIATVEPRAPRAVDANVPVDLEAIVMKCLEKDRSARYDSARALAEDLDRFLGGEPVAARSAGVWYRLRKRLRKHWRLAAAAGVAVAVSGGAVGWGISLRWRARADLDRAIAAHEADAGAAIHEGEEASASAEALRANAFARFDEAGGASAEETRARVAEAERVWTDALAASARADTRFAAAERSLEAAFVIDAGRETIRARIGDVLLERVVLSEQIHNEERRRDLVDRLASFDPGRERQRRLAAPPRLSVETSPPDAQIEIVRDEDDGGRRRLGAPLPLGRTPRPGVEIAAGPGSYRLTIRAPDRAPVRLALLLARGEDARVALDLPRLSEIPVGYVYVPPGRFLVGTAMNEQLRRGLLNAAPLHEARTGGYLLASEEVTFADWLRFLRDLPPAERARQTLATRSSQGELELRELPDGVFQLTIGSEGERAVAREGEPIRFPARTRRAAQDWRRFPAAGVSMPAAEAYLAWLDRTGRVPGARLCDEWEWERGARGADDRMFPNGDQLDADDANFDETYGRISRAFGPDEAGAHPASESPYGAFDMVGNVFEWVRSRGARDETEIRGGAWYYDRLTSSIPNRTLVEAKVKDVTVGLRVCAGLSR